MTTSEQCKVIKKALSEVYGSRNVTCHKGTGTAFMWIHAYVTKHELADAREVARNARRIAKEALENVGEKFSTYCSDDGQDSENDCFLLQVE